MTQFRLELTNGKAGYGGSHYDYISRLGKYRKCEQGEDLVCSGSENLPAWTNGDARMFWKTSDLYERSTGNAYRGFTLRLPYELSNEDNIQLTKEFLQKELGDKFTYSYAIHSKPSSKPGVQNIHVHVMIDFRLNDGIERGAQQYFKQYSSKNPSRGGCKKVDPYQRKKGTKGQGASNNLIKTRESWKDEQNRYLERAGLDIRVDHRSYKEQGLDIIPTERLHVKAYKQWKKTGIDNEQTLRNKAIEKHNKLSKQEKLLKKQKELIKEKISIEKQKEAANLQKGVEKQKRDYYKEIDSLRKERSMLELKQKKIIDEHTLIKDEPEIKKRNERERG